MDFDDVGVVESLEHFDVVFDLVAFFGGEDALVDGFEDSELVGGGLLDGPGAARDAFHFEFEDLVF